MKIMARFDLELIENISQSVSSRKTNLKFLDLQWCSRVLCFSFLKLLFYFFQFKDHNLKWFKYTTFVKYQEEILRGPSHF